MSQQSHYEILSHSGGIWTVEAVAPGYDEAIERANAIQRTSDSEALKVNQVSFNNSAAQFHEKEVFFLGTRPSTARTYGDDVDAGAPCHALEDIYALPSRQAIRRVMRQWLDAHRLTAVELLYLPEYINRFAGSGSMLQGTVQRAAMAQAGAYNMDVKVRQRELHTLFDEVSAKAKSMWRSELIPAIENDDLDALADRLTTGKDKEYIFNAALANWLRRFDSGLAKFIALLELATQSKKPATTAHLDSFLTDFLEDASLVARLIGNQNSLGDAVLRLAELINPGAAATAAIAAGVPATAKKGAAGNRPAVQDEIYDDSVDDDDAFLEHPAVEQFRKLMWRGRFPKCRQTLIRRMKQTVLGPRSFTGDGAVADAQLLRRMHDGLCDEDGNFVLGADLEAAFVTRSQTYLTSTSIGGMLEGVALPLQRLEILLEVEKGIFGDAGRQRIGAYILAILQEPENQTALRKPDIAPAVHMRSLAVAQRRANESSLSETQKHAAEALLDELGGDLMAEGQILAKIADRSSSNIDECISILKLCAAGSFTEGRAADMARKRATAVMRAPGFAKAFLRRANDTAEMKAMLAELEILMTKAGTSELPLMGAMAAAQA